MTKFLSGRRSRITVYLAVILFAAGLILWRISFPSSTTEGFNGQRAFNDIQAQVNFGPRVPGSQSHSETIAYIQDELHKAGWTSKIQKTTWDGFELENIISSKDAQAPIVILGAHYDTRMIADRDQATNQINAVPGANDGASGVAILLELARTLPKGSIPIWLVFFDAEDDGGLDGREWIMGSRAFVNQLEFRPRAAVIVDMVGDSDLNIYIERNSNNQLVSEIWGTAAKLGFANQFIPTAKYSILDDHTPFLEAGIPAVDIIDFDYLYWHTSADTPDKLSPRSLQIVGDTLLTWILTQH